MQVSIESTGSLERKLTVKIPAERVRERFNELGRTVRIKGFRPGKVPAKVIEQRYGQQVRSEAMNEEIGRSFQEAVRQEKLRPAVAPAIPCSRACSIIHSYNAAPPCLSLSPKKMRRRQPG